MAVQQTACVVWRFSDGKPGHDAQSCGLINALAHYRSLQVHEIAVNNTKYCGLYGLYDFIYKRFSAGEQLPRPALLIGAGHATHWPLLLARRARGGRLIVLMKPSLPKCWFDLCIIPQHDDVVAGRGVFTTQGPLNSISPAHCLDVKQGLFLIGGPSKHYAWSCSNMLQQIQQIARSTPEIHWLLTTSRRTPEAFLTALNAMQMSNLQVIPHSTTPSGWVAAQLAKAAQVWVSEDSLSMIYEALTAGASVGLLHLPSKRASRVIRATKELIEAGYVTAYAAWQLGAKLPAPKQPLNEAERCAAWIHRDWLD